MTRQLKPFFAIMAVCIAGIIMLQVLWLRTYYQVHQQRFREDVSAALMAAVQTLRASEFDRIQDSLFQFVADPAHVQVTSYWDGACGTYVYSFANTMMKGDRFTFGDNSLNFPINPGDETSRLAVIRGYARIYREQNLERQSAFFQTRNIQKFVAALQRPMDSALLASAYHILLADKEILQPFSLHISGERNNPLSDDKVQTLPVATTFANQFVTACFDNPFSYLVRKMAILLLGSVVLVTLIGLALFYFLRSLQRQKKLSLIKNDFISNITHELKTPITTVSAAIESMEYFEEAKDPAKRLKYLNTSKREISRLSDLVDKILHVSLYESHDFVLKAEQVDVDELMHELLQSNEAAGPVSLALSYRNLSLVRTVTGDRLHLFQALNNLMENAVKYSRGEVRVDVTAYKANGFCVFEVRDNGIGIAKENIPYLFDKFYRVPTGNRHAVKGFGLGLFYVKTISERHGGWCRVESRLGVGSTFKIGLPYDA